MPPPIHGILLTFGLCSFRPEQKKARRKRDNSVKAMTAEEAAAMDAEIARNKSCRRSLQTYRKAWEDIPEYSLWLTSHPSKYKAVCMLCNRMLTADSTTIGLHSLSKRHMEAEKNYYRAKMRENKRVAAAERSDDAQEDAESIAASLQGMGFSDDDAPLAEGGTGEGPESKQQFIMYRDEHHYTADGGGSISGGVGGDYSAGIYVPVQQESHGKSDSSRDMTTKVFVTKRAPHWKATAIVNGHVTKLDMNDYKGRYVVLFFYAHNFSKVDASEINRLSDRIADFRTVHTEIVACSTDSHLSHLTWAKKSRGEGGVSGVKIPLIADPTHIIARDYGVYLPEKGHCLRAHFVIDRRGVLRHVAINDPLIGRGTDELLRIVKALQFSDQVEEPLVADWTPDP
ncbi:unnamed protein product [Nesidiocoris tenuis]|nr:Oxidoreductases [Nesidiocoris tenuis]CAB0009152.1 unnamed protein product [Nesidiocoris tenuis]